MRLLRCALTLVSLSCKRNAEMIYSSSLSSVSGQSTAGRAVVGLALINSNVHCQCASTATTEINRQTVSRQYSISRPWPFSQRIFSSAACPCPELRMFTICFPQRHRLSALPTMDPPSTRPNQQLTPSPTSSFFFFFFVLSTFLKFIQEVEFLVSCFQSILAS